MNGSADDTLNLPSAKARAGSIEQGIKSWFAGMKVDHASNAVEYPIRTKYDRCDTAPRKPCTGADRLFARWKTQKVKRPPTAGASLLS